MTAETRFPGMGMKMGTVAWTKAALAAFVFLMTTATPAAEPREVSKEASWTWFGAYKPKNPASLSDIPAPIRARLMAHLRARLGDGFVDRLQFTGGQVIDFVELRRVEPHSKNYKWEVPAYILHFAFKMPEAGIAKYSAEISLRSDGSVLKDIDLPRFSDSPGKLVLIPLSQAIDIAASRGFSRDAIDVEFGYDPKADALVWTIEQEVADDGVVIDSTRIDVSAHTGEVLKVYESQAIR